MALAVKLTKGAPAKRAALLVVFATQGKTPKLTPAHKSVALNAALKHGSFEGAAGSCSVAYGGTGERANVFLIVGLGVTKSVTLETLRAAGGIIAREARRLKTASVDVLTPAVTNRAVSADAGVGALAEGALLGSYHLDLKSRGSRNKSPLKSITLYTKNPNTAQRAALKGAQARAEGVRVARDLVTLPGNDCTPRHMMITGRKIAASTPRIRAHILDKAKLKQLKMGGILGVNQGSTEPPFLVCLEYKPSKPSNKTVCLVGKGLTFDTGGISLKPGAGMEGMKWDMAGGACVLGTMAAVAKLAPKINVIGIVGTTDNMPDGNAYKPGDVLRMYSGLTVEVINTDAEGRLVLADALAYALKHYKPDYMIDYATLTGACMVALGQQCAGIMSPDDGLATHLLAAGESSGDRVWRLPLWPEYGEQIKSKIADLKNTGGRFAGSITAGYFLKHFAQPEGTRTKWAHVDMAGMAWNDKGKPHQPPGAVGFGVRLNLALLKRLGA